MLLLQQYHHHHHHDLQLLLHYSNFFFFFFFFYYYYYYDNDNDNNDDNNHCCHRYLCRPCIPLFSFPLPRSPLPLPCLIDAQREEVEAADKSVKEMRAELDVVKKNAMKMERSVVQICIRE
jgi:hypothetical protein